MFSSLAYHLQIHSFSKSSLASAKIEQPKDNQVLPSQLFIDVCVFTSVRRREDSDSFANGKSYHHVNHTQNEKKQEEQK